MKTNLINTSISTQVLKFKPGSSPAFFEVTVVNESDRFASFQLELIAAGASADPGFRWYWISPAVSAKKPPGATTRFDVAIADSPVPGFAGIMNLTVRVFSLELRDEARQVVRLIVQEGADSNPLKVELPVKQFQGYPRDVIEMPVRLYNNSYSPADVTLNFQGLEFSWLTDGSEKKLRLEPGEQTEILLFCQPPAGCFAAQYPFVIQATQRSGAPVRIEGIVEVLPAGSVKFTCTPKERTIPPKRADAASYELAFENASNLNTSVRPEVRFKDRQKCTVELLPDTADLNSGETAQIFLVANKQRHRWGMPKKLLLEVTPILSDSRLGNTEPATQILKLRVLPIIPFWLQLLGLLLALLVILVLIFQPYEGHRAPVTSVSFSGLADRVVSGSEDQTLRDWGVQNNRLFSRGILASPGKAARVIRFRPVDNNLVAAGLENGEIQLWNVLSGKRQKAFDFFYQKDDRVFGLEFTKDSRSLYSGHGSGAVLQWNLDPELLNDANSANLPSRQKQLDFAVYDIALVGKEEKDLAIAGRYNQLVLWNLTADKLRRLPYRLGGQDDYITSLDTADDKPNRLAIADNQGTVTLWNVRQCLTENTDCEILDQWIDANSTAIRSVALSSDGCYLASGGDDGQVKLWPLTAEGKRDIKFLDGTAIAKLPIKINSVDLKLVDNRIIVVSGSDDSRVRLYRVQNDSTCN